MFLINLKENQRISEACRVQRGVSHDVEVWLGKCIVWKLDWKNKVDWFDN